MGTKVAPSFEVTYMGTFEEAHVYTYVEQPLMYVRYIDDVFIIWQNGNTKLQQFFTHVNNSSPHIKFTTETSTKEIPFLDTLVKLSGTNISTDLYTKPTDSHNYLYYDSAHPQRCKDSIPYSQFLRIRRICTLNEDFDRNVIELCKHFLRRKYPLKLLHQAATLARGKDRATLLEPTINPDTRTVEEDKVFLITTYHPHDQFIPDLTRKNWEILGCNQTTEYLHNRKLVCGFRRPKNLRNHLCRARVKRLPGDEEADPTYVAPIPSPPTPGAMKPRTTRQTTIQEFAIDTTTTGQTGFVPIIPNLPSTPNTRIPQSTNPHIGKKRGYSYCKHTGCRYCKLLNKTGTIKSTTTGKHHKTMRKVSCRSSNVIYAITCKRCGIQYVGQTLLRLKDRFVGHFGDINNCSKKKKCPNTSPEKTT